MSACEGVAINANPALLAVFHDLYGKDVLVETYDGKKFRGLFMACSPMNLDIGIRHAYEITESNKDNYFPLKTDVKEKIQFMFSDVIALTTILEENKGKQSREFITDREYNPVVDANGEANMLEEWKPDEDPNGEDLGLGELEDDPREKRRGYGSNGWRPEDMFHTNKTKFKVTSTYDDNLTQYTTVEKFEGTAEQRREADRLAREIENSKESQHYQKLENDDGERDLDKRTDYEQSGHGRGDRDRRGQGGRGGKGSGPSDRERSDRGRDGRDGQQRRDNAGGFGNTSSQITNRRAEGLRSGGGGRISGPPPQSSRYDGPNDVRAMRGQQQQQQQGQQGPHKSQQSYSQPRRDSDHGDWKNPSMTAGGAASGRDSTVSSIAGSSTGPKSGITATTAGQTPSQAAAATASQQTNKQPASYKMLLPHKDTKYGTVEHVETLDGDEETKNNGGRVEDLRSWGNAFDSKFKEQPPQGTQSDATQQVHHLNNNGKQGGSAWSNGPPQGLVHTGQEAQRATESPGSSSDATPATAGPSSAIGKAASPSHEAQTSIEKEEREAAKEKSQPKEGEKEAADKTDAAAGEKKDDSGAESSITSKSADGSTSKAKTSSFKFNPNATEFKPRAQSTTSSSQLDAQPHQPPQAMHQAPPMQATMLVPAGMGPAMTPQGQIMLPHGHPQGAAVVVVSQPQHPAHMPQIQMQPVMAPGVAMSAATGQGQPGVAMAPPPMMHAQPMMYATTAAGAPPSTGPQYHAGYPPAAQWQQVQMMQAGHQGMAIAAAAAASRQQTAQSQAAHQPAVFIPAAAAGPQRRVANQTAVMMPQTSTAAVGAQWQGQMIVGAQPPMMQVPYNPAYQAAAYPTSAAGMPGPPQGGQQFPQQQGIMAGGPAGSQPGPGGMVQPGGGPPQMQPAALATAQQGIYQQQRFPSQMAYIPGQTGMPQQQTAMPPGAARMYAGQQGQQMSGPPGGMQGQHQHPQDLNQIHYQGWVPQPMTPAGTPHSQPHSHLQPSHHRQPAFYPTPGQQHPPSIVHPPSSASHTNTHHISPQGSHHLQNSNRLPSSYNGQPSSAHNSQPPTPGPAPMSGNMPPQPQPTPTPSLAGGVRSGSPAISTTGQLPPQSYPYMTGQPHQVQSSQQQQHQQQLIITSQAPHMQGQHPYYGPATVYYQNAAGQGMIIPYSMQQHAPGGTQQPGQHDGPPHSHASMDGAMLNVHSPQVYGGPMQGGQEQQYAQQQQHNYMQAVAGPPYYHQHQQQGHQGQGQGAGSHQQSMSRQNSVPQQQAQTQPASSTVTSSVSQPPATQSSASSAAGSHSPPQGSAN